MCERMSLSEFNKLMGAAHKSSVQKYHNIKTAVDGILFDSKLEAGRYAELKLLKQAGQIKSFKRQPSFLFDSGIRYRPDFIVWGLD